MIVLGGIAQGESDEELLMAFWHFDENNDLGSSKALVLIFLKRSLVYHYNAI